MIPVNFLYAISVFTTLSKESGSREELTVDLNI